eukprot:CAMPEP_0113691250 /NCGR_PEP_ID=MMETSP0038_2-20120614/18312_1 /TAXON_ID=2898 /ORGANISM="Cryptomonas paramecium" /LENGTH=145 /DNA_ID=CAMNT_0000612805 /DNA_START=139 /DNA_END=576 /DNA_ORIENTATION=- /assembly_acc=CAM_ASM_000170
MLLVTPIQSRAILLGPFHSPRDMLLAHLLAPFSASLHQQSSLRADPAAIRVSRGMSRSDEATLPPLARPPAQSPGSTATLEGNRDKVWVNPGPRLRVCPRRKGVGGRHRGAGEPRDTQEHDGTGITSRGQARLCATAATCVVIFC